MRQFRKWQRALFLSLLSLSVFAPIVLVSNRSKYLSLHEKTDFAEDLSSIKYRAETLKLSAIGQEEANGVKEPKQEVYIDQSYSVISRNPNGNGTGARYNVEVDSSKYRLKDLPSSRFQKGQESSGGNIEHRETFQALPATKFQQIPQLQKRRSSDERIRQMKDQLVRARAYLNFATNSGNTHLVKELKLRIKEVERAVGEVKRDKDLPRRASTRIKNLESALSKASRAYPDCSGMVKKLRAMALTAEEQVRAHRNQTAFLTRLAGRTTPKGLHCLSMRLTAQYFTLQPEEKEPRNQENFHDPSLFHYVVFSDNILAAAVVVNSTVSASKQPEKTVFHVVTDSLNFPGISMWFLLNPPAEATIQIQSTADIKELEQYGSPPLQEAMDPRFSSPLNHLRFYLPEIFPQLDKIVFLDHDVVVQKDITSLWQVDMKGKINGAVQTCEGGISHRRMDLLINFSDPWVAETFNADSCTWSFGMNLFNLREWRNQGLLEKYSSFRQMGLEKPLWKSGSLPIGWVTFYNHTLPLPWEWHVLGLGYDSDVSNERIEKAAVIHYDGIMKPWMDIGIRRYKGLWTKHVNFDNPLLRQCNIQG